METSLVGISTLTFAMLVISLILSLVVKTLSHGSKKKMWLMLVIAVALMSVSELITLGVVLGYTSGFTLFRQVTILLAGLAFLSFFKEASEVF